MIKLRITENGQDRQLSFTKRVISFGPKESNADVLLEDEGLESPHILIEETNGRYVVVNCAGDPRTRFNHLPFGRRSLLSGSKLTVGRATIEIEYVDDLIEESLGKPLRLPEIEPIVYEPEPPPKLLKKKAPPPEQKLPVSLRTLQIFFFSFLMISFAVAGILGGIYLSNTIQNEEEEIKAARGVADTAMALLYAKIHQIRPHNNNWTDPYFLQSVLGGLLTKGKSHFSDVDAQGRFKDIPYMLRIYTSGDASRFLLVAQPEPQFMGWFHQKEALVVDSTQMELRKISDIQPINRLLLDSAELNGDQQYKLSLLVKGGDLIPLSKLDDRNSCSQFTPPSELALVAPGAENYIYNCPRYYKLTEPMLFKSIAGELTKEAEQELNKLLALNSPVFYTSEGIKTAVKGYRSLLSQIDKENLHLGYFVHHPKTLLPDHAELLVMSQAPQTTGADRVKTLEGTRTPIKVRPSISKTFTKLSGERKKNLQELSENIFDLLQKNDQTPYSGFKRKLLDALREYERVDNDEQKRIASHLQTLYQHQVLRDRELTSDEFLALASEAQLHPYIKRQSKVRDNLLKQAKGKLLPRPGDL